MVTEAVMHGEADDGVLPSVRDLPLIDQALYHAAVTSDYGLRTALASATGAAALTPLLTGDWRAERRRLRFYADRAAALDPAFAFPDPAPVRVEATEGRAAGLPGGRVEVLRFHSAYVTRNPQLRESYAAHANNGIARAQHWRHEDGPRPTLCVVHGFGASPAWFNIAFFALREIFAGGWDILLHTLPFHGSRRGRLSPVNGIELMAGGLATLNEGLLQGVHDFRVLVDHLEAQGVERIGVTGLSLGGCTTGLIAAAEPRMEFAVPNAAVTWIPPLLKGWFPANVSAALVRTLARVDDELVEDALRFASPLSYPPVVAKDKLLIVAGLGDRLAPPEQSLLLWEHWGRPALEWFPGSHVLHFGREDYRRAVGALMAA